MRFESAMMLLAYIGVIAICFSPDGLSFTVAVYITGWACGAWCGRVQGRVDNEREAA